MSNELNYVCGNTEQPNEYSDEEFHPEMPIFENVLLDTKIPEHELDSLWDLMSLYSLEAERSYHTIDRKKFEKFLIKVVNVKAEHTDDGILIRYDFENGESYIPDITRYAYHNFDQEIIDKLLSMAKEAAPHIFLIDTTLKESDFLFICEQWG